MDPPWRTCEKVVRLFEVRRGGSPRLRGDGDLSGGFPGLCRGLSPALGVAHQPSPRRARRRLGGAQRRGRGSWPTRRWCGRTPHPTLGRPRSRLLRGRRAAAVRLARLRARGRSLHPPPEQLRRPAASLDLRSLPGERSGVLAREPDRRRRAPPLPVRGRSAHRPLRPARGVASRASRDAGRRRFGSRGGGAPRLGPWLRGGRVPVLGWPGGASAPRGRPLRRPGRVLEEPVPGPLRSPARVPLRPSRRSAPARERPRAPAAGPARASRVGVRAALGRATALPPAHVPLRLGGPRALGPRPGASGR